MVAAKLKYHGKHRHVLCERRERMIETRGGRPKSKSTYLPCPGGDKLPLKEREVDGRIHRKTRDRRGNFLV